jgi:hypothetical protein
LVEKRVAENFSVYNGADVDTMREGKDAQYFSFQAVKLLGAYMKGCGFFWALRDSMELGAEVSERRGDVLRLTFLIFFPDFFDDVIFLGDRPFFIIALGNKVPQR